MITSLDLKKAVGTFLALRCRVIDDRTRKLGRDKALVEIQRLAVNLQDVRVENVCKIWNRAWMLPFFSGQRRDLALQRIKDARAVGDLCNYKTLVGACNDGHSWSVKRNQDKPNGHSVIACGAAAKAFCERSGNYSSARYKTNPAVLLRVARLANLLHVGILKHRKITSVERRPAPSRSARTL